MNFDGSDDIRFRYVPIVRWACGAILLLVCFTILLIGLVSGFFSWILIFFLALASVIIFCNSFFLLAPMTTVVFSPESKYIQVSNARIYGKRVNRYYLSQVEKFKSYKAKLNFSQQYFLALVRSNRKTIKLKVPIGRDKQETVKLIKNLNKIIRTSRRDQR